MECVLTPVFLFLTPPYCSSSLPSAPPPPPCCLQGWTVGEILRNVPGHNWVAYNAELASNPVLAKMCISGVVYTLGDYSAQMVEGRGALGFDRSRMLRSGLVGFCLHGSLSHYYYYFCEVRAATHLIYIYVYRYACVCIYIYIYKYISMQSFVFLT